MQKALETIVQMLHARGAASSLEDLLEEDGGGGSGGTLAKAKLALDDHLTKQGATSLSTMFTIEVGASAVVCFVLQPKQQRIAELRKKMDALVDRSPDTCRWIIIVSLDLSESNVATLTGRGGSKAAAATTAPESSKTSSSRNRSSTSNNADTTTNTNTNTNTDTNSTNNGSARGQAAAAVLIQHFYLHELQYNLMEHELVPKHRVMSPAESAEVLRKYALKSKSQMPLISKNDAVCRFLGARPGEVIEIIRPSPRTVTFTTYRFCT